MCRADSDVTQLFILLHVFIEVNLYNTIKYFLMRIFHPEGLLLQLCKLQKTSCNLHNYTAKIKLLKYLSIVLVSAVARM